MPEYTVKYKKNLEEFLNTLNGIEIPEKYKKYNELTTDKSFYNDRYDKLTSLEWKNLDIHNCIDNMKRLKGLSGQKVMEDPNYLLRFNEDGYVYNNLEDAVYQYYSDKDAQKLLKYEEEKELSEKLFKMAKANEELKIRLEVVHTVSIRENMVKKIQAAVERREKLLKFQKDFWEEYPDFQYEEERKKLEMLKEQKENMKADWEEFESYRFMSDEGRAAYKNSYQELLEQIQASRERLKKADNLYKEYQQVETEYRSLDAYCKREENGQNQLTESITKRMKGFYSHINDAKKEGHADSSEYQRIILALENVSEKTAGIQEIRELKEAAQSYLEAKQKQSRGIFASNQRKVRIKFANDLISFCQICEETLQIPEVSDFPQKEVFDDFQKNNDFEVKKGVSKEEFFKSSSEEKLLENLPSEEKLPENPYEENMEKCFRILQEIEIPEGMPSNWFSVQNDFNSIKKEQRQLKECGADKGKMAEYVQHKAGYLYADRMEGTAVVFYTNMFSLKNEKELEFAQKHFEVIRKKEELKIRKGAMDAMDDLEHIHSQLKGNMQMALKLRAELAKDGVKFVNEYPKFDYEEAARQREVLQKKELEEKNGEKKEKINQQIRKLDQSLDRANNLYKKYGQIQELYKGLREYGKEGYHTAQWESSVKNRIHQINSSSIIFKITKMEDKDSSRYEKMIDVMDKFKGDMKIETVEKLDRAAREYQEEQEQKLEAMTEKIKRFSSHVGDNQKESHENSPEYQRIISNLEKLSGKPAAGIDDIKELKEAVQGYLDEKKKQNRGIFASTQRKTRLALAENLHSLCGQYEEMITSTHRMLRLEQAKSIRSLCETYREMSRIPEISRNSPRYQEIVEQFQKNNDLNPLPELDKQKFMKVLSSGQPQAKMQAQEKETEAQQIRQPEKVKEENIMINLG